MVMRLIVVAASVSVLAGSGWASWSGMGLVSRDTGAAVAATSVRSGSAGGGLGRFRVK